MHVIFTDEEKEWIHTDKMNWPIKKGCPKKIKESIENKKNKIKSQFEFMGN